MQLFSGSEEKFSCMSHIMSVRSNLSHWFPKIKTHVTLFNFACVFLGPYAVCLRHCQEKSYKTHTSAKLLHCLYQQQCDNLEAMRHIAGLLSLPAECCQSCHLAGELYAFHLYLSSLPSSLCLVMSLLVFLIPAHLFQVFLLLVTSLFSTLVYLSVWFPPGHDHTLK